MESFAAFVCRSHYGIHKLKDTVETFDRIIEVLPKLLLEIHAALVAKNPPAMHEGMVNMIAI